MFFCGPCCLQPQFARSQFVESLKVDGEVDSLSINISTWSQALLAKRQEQLASFQLPPPPPQDSRPQTGGQIPGQYQQSTRPHQGSQSGSQAQIQSGPNMPHHQPKSEPMSRYQQPLSQQHQQQRSWGTQEPIRYPGAKPADRVWPVYSAPYTVPYYAAQYNTPQQPPQQPQARKGTASGHFQNNKQHSYGPNPQAGAAHAFSPPVFQAPGQQRQHIAQESVDAHQHPAAFISRTEAFISDRHAAGGANQVLPYQTPDNYG